MLTKVWLYPTIRGILCFGFFLGLLLSWNKEFENNLVEHGRRYTNERNILFDSFLDLLLS